MWLGGQRAAFGALTALCRGHSPLRHRDCGVGNLDTPVRAEEGGCRSKVGAYQERPVATRPLFFFLFLSLTSFLRPCREMQLFLIGYIVIEICEIFTVGEIPLTATVRIVRRRPTSPRLGSARPC